VFTRIIIIDRRKGGNDGEGRTSVNNSDRLHKEIEGDIKAVFNQIESMIVLARVEVVEPAPIYDAIHAVMAKHNPPQAAFKPPVTMHAHGRMVADASEATYRKVGDKLETDATVEKYPVAQGKVLEGVYWGPSEEMITAVDRLTWRPKGQANYFVCIKHVTRPRRDTPRSAVAHRHWPRIT
jgi:hypothetical protein